MHLTLIIQNDMPAVIYVIIHHQALPLFFRDSYVNYIFDSNISGVNFAMKNVTTLLLHSIDTSFLLRLIQSY